MAAAVFQSFVPVVDHPADFDGPVFPPEIQAVNRIGEERIGDHDCAKIPHGHLYLSLLDHDTGEDFLQGADFAKGKIRGAFDAAIEGVFADTQHLGNFPSAEFRVLHLAP